MTKPKPYDLVLDRLKAKHRELRLAEMSLRERLEQQLQEELTVLRVERSRLAIEAYAAGASKTRIGKAINTSDWATVNGMLRLAKPTKADLEFEQSAEDAEAAARAYADENPFDYDPETMILIVRKWPNEKRTGMQYGEVILQGFIDVRGSVDFPETEQIRRIDSTYAYSQWLSRNEPPVEIIAPPTIDPTQGWGILPEDLEDEDDE